MMCVRNIQKNRHFPFDRQGQRRDFKYYTVRLSVWRVQLANESRYRYEKEKESDTKE